MISAADLDALELAAIDARRGLTLDEAEREARRGVRVDIVLKGQDPSVTKEDLLAWIGEQKRADDEGRRT